MQRELIYKTCEVERQDEQQQKNAEAGMQKIINKNWDLSKDEFDEILQAFRDIYEACEYAIDSYKGYPNATREEHQSIREYRSMRKSIRLLFIQWGIYQVITDEEIRNTISTKPGDKKYDFVHAGQKYDFESWDFPGRPV